MYPIVHCSTIYNSLEKETATHSSILAWRIPGMEEPGGLPSMGSHACIGEINGNPLYYSCLGIPEMEEPGGLPYESNL